MYILHDLWNGELYPAEINCPTDEQYRTARKHMVEQEDLIWQENQNAFVQGVRFGVQFMLDALSCEEAQKRP